MRSPESFAFLEGYSLYDMGTVITLPLHHIPARKNVEEQYPPVK
jgi:hypothetical protein